MADKKYCKHGFAKVYDFCEFCAEEKTAKNAYLIKQAALNATNELLKKNGMTPIELAKEAIKRKESIEPRMPRAK